MKLKIAMRIFGALALCASLAAAETSVWVEAEDYFLLPSNNAGGGIIRRGFCGSASENYCADGVDWPGDWIQLEVDIPIAGDYNLFSAFQAYDGDEHAFQVSLGPEARGDVNRSVQFDIVGTGAG